MAANGEDDGKKHPKDVAADAIHQKAKEGRCDGRDDVNDRIDGVGFAGRIVKFTFKKYSERQVRVNTFP